MEDSENIERSTNDLIKKVNKNKIAPTLQKRAAAGGEYGPNKEWYKGGSFIATTDMPKKIRAKWEKMTSNIKHDIQVGRDKREKRNVGMFSPIERLAGSAMDLDGRINNLYLLKIGGAYETQAREAIKRWTEGEVQLPINDFPLLINATDLVAALLSGYAVSEEVIRSHPWASDYVMAVGSIQELKMSIRSIIKDILLEETSGISFETQHTASHHGQSDFTLYLLVNGKKVAYLDYTIFQGETQIAMVEVPKQEDKRKGYGRMLVDRLAHDRGGYDNIQWGSMTPDGSALQQAMDRERGFDRQEHENLHYRMDDMMKLISKKSRNAAGFFQDLCAIGYGDAWKKWAPHIKDSHIDGIDQSDLAALAEWTRGSIENNHPTDWEPKDQVQQFVMGLMSN